MYTTGSVLSLKEPKAADEETGEEFPYNRVRVLGESPVSHSHKGVYTGADAVGVLLTPLTNFGSTLDEPFGKLRQIYTVTEVPEDIIIQPTIRVVSSTRNSAGPTPEDVFAEEAPGVAPEEGQTRGRTPLSPLDDPGAPGTKGPLD